MFHYVLLCFALLFCFVLFCLNLKAAQITFHIKNLRKIELLKLYFNKFLSVTILIKCHYCYIVHFYILLFLNDTNIFSTVRYVTFFPLIYLCIIPWSV